MKNYVNVIGFLAVIILMCQSALSQEDIQIGSGDNTSMSLPIYGDYNYSYSQQIYLQNEINYQGQITKVRFLYKGGFFTDNSNQWNVYLAHTSKSSFDNENDWVSPANLTLVYSGEITFPLAGEWLEINLTNPFEYNNIDNLVIGIFENKESASMNVEWGSFYPGNTRGLCLSDDTEVNPITLGEANIFTGNIPQVQLYIITAQCPDPENILISNITSESAQVSWSNFGNEINLFIKYGLSGFNPNDAGTLISLNSLPITLENLDPNTTYDFYAMNQCEGDLFSNWTGPFSFTTLCSKFTNDIFESFESASAPADCWSIVYGSSSPHPNNIVTHSTDIASDGTRSLRFSSYEYDPQSFTQYLISPEINFTDEVKLMFKYRKTYSYRFDNFRVGYSLNNSDPQSFIWQPIVTNVPSYQWADYEFTFPQGTKFIAIQYNPDETDWSGEYLYIDELLIINDENLTNSNNHFAESEILIYPNPNNGIFSIYANNNFYYEIYDATGKLVLTNNSTENISQVNISGFSNGIYLIKIIDGNKILNYRIIKE